MRLNTHSTASFIFLAIFACIENQMMIMYFSVVGYAVGTVFGGLATLRLVCFSKSYGKLKIQSLPNIR